MEVRKGKTVIDGNAFYELDPECLRRKKEQNTSGDKEREGRWRSFKRQRR